MENSEILDKLLEVRMQLYSSYHDVIRREKRLYAQRKRLDLAVARHTELNRMAIDLQFLLRESKGKITRITTKSEKAIEERAIKAIENMTVEERTAMVGRLLKVKV